MNKLQTLILVGLSLTATNSQAQYNKLRIPDTMSGKTFNLVLKDTFTQFKTGQTTITAGVNSNFWGPTLIFNQGDTVHMNILNKLNDSTTVHWHGFHLPAVMDGGPHQVIPPNTVWRPYWKVKNDAATYWYHPHLHEMTQEQMTKGLGGLIIVRDAVEGALALPRTYGVDDIPVVLTSRRYSTSNQFVVKNSSYGDYMFTNGTTNAEFTIPKQMVRLRILNAEMERSYNLGFSDNRTFYVISSGGGLFDKPIAVTRLPIHVGERYEILVDCSNDAVGATIDLNAFNSGQSQSFPGGEPAPGGGPGGVQPGDRHEERTPRFPAHRRGGARSGGRPAPGVVAPQFDPRAAGTAAAPLVSGASEPGAGHAAGTAAAEAGAAAGWWGALQARTRRSGGPGPPAQSLAGAGPPRCRSGHPGAVTAGSPPARAAAATARAGGSDASGSGAGRCGDAGAAPKQAAPNEAAPTGSAGQGSAN